MLNLSLLMSLLIIMIFIYAKTPIMVTTFFEQAHG